MKSILNWSRIQELKYSIETLHDGIYCIKNFLTQDEVSETYQYVENLKEEDWVSQQDYEINPEWNDKIAHLPNHFQIRRAHERMRDIICDNHEYEYKIFSTVQRHYPGSKLYEHVDSGHSPKLYYASVVYLNDNYNGGELYFPNQNIEIKPSVGSLMMFPTKDEFLHGTRKVEDGPTRYVSSSFIWLK